MAKLLTEWKSEYNNSKEKKNHTEEKVTTKILIKILHFKLGGTENKWEKNIQRESSGIDEDIVGISHGI